LIDRFVSRYTNPKTSHQYRAELTALLRHVGVTHPRLLSDAAVNQWVALARANNRTSHAGGHAVVFGVEDRARVYAAPGVVLDRPGGDDLRRLCLS
jgi:hypothetical protein